MQKNILSNAKSFASIFTCQFSKIQIFYSKPLPKPKKLRINVFKGILLLQKLYALFHIDRFPRTNNPSNYKPVRSRIEFEENVVAYSFSANRCGGGWLSVSDHGARGKRWGGSRKKAEKDKELEDIFASDIWRIESRIDTGQNDVSKGGECTACCLTVNIFTIVCRVYYIRVKRWNSVLLVYVIYSYVNWELCFDSVLFVPSRDIVEQRHVCTT